MIDPQPSGYITVRHAFELFIGTWPEPEILADRQKLTDVRLEQFRYALGHDQLRVQVTFPERDGLFDIPPALWSAAGFPELEILHDDVPKHAPDAWRPYVGRTLFIREDGFRTWLLHNGYQPPPEPTDFDDPSQLATWTVPMVCAWISERNIESVRWQMSQWRRAHGWPDASLALAAIGRSVLLGEGEEAGEEEEEDNPAHFDSMSSMKELTRAGESGTITAMGMSSTTGQPAPLQPSDWTYGRLEFDGKLAERWRVGATLFTALTFRRDEVQVRWPANVDRQAAPSMPLTAPIGRGSRTPSAECRVILAFITDRYNGSWPADLTNAKVAERARAWAEETQERRAEYLPVGIIDESTVRRLRKRGVDGRIKLPTSAE
ncbi:MAG: hypothetical protein ABL879_01570 [Devosia sp.]